MTRSANEVQTIVAKAARGAGAPAAQAAAFGRAAVCHLGAGRGEDGLRAAFDALPQGPILDIPLALARLVQEARDGIARGVLDCAAAPALTLGYCEALPFKHSARPMQQGVDVTIETTIPAPRAPVQRLVLSADFAEFLCAHLAKTLVPDTPSSRSAGAGAGLNDND